MSDDYPQSLGKEEVLPGAHGATVELSEIFVRGKTFLITFTFRRGQALFTKDLGVTIVRRVDGVYDYSINWKKVKGWLDHDCNLRQLGADRWIPRLQARFAEKAQTHVNTLAQQ
jgi:hypothetical protein